MSNGRGFERYFYNDEIVKIVKNHTTEGLIECYNFDQQKYVRYERADFKHRAKKAYTASQVGDMINRHPKVVLKHILAGDIPEPRRAQHIHVNDRQIGSEGMYLFSEKDIWNLWEFFAGRSRGPHPKKPRVGPITNKTLIPRQDLTAILREGTVYYIKLDDGTFVPTWKAERF